METSGKLLGGATPELQDHNVRRLLLSRAPSHSEGLKTAEETVVTALTSPNRGPRSR